MVRRNLLWFFMILFSLGLTGISGVYADKELHDFLLYKAQGDPAFSLGFPITIKGPCEVKINMKVTSEDTSLKQPLLLTLTKMGKKKQAVAAVYYKQGQKSINLRYAVDSIELERGHDYMVYISNFSRKRNAAGQILITFYGKEGPEEGAKAVYADLAITGMRVYKKNELLVEITNKGPGKIPNIYYQKNIPVLQIYSDGKSWGEVSLAVLDPQKKLKEAGAKISVIVPGYKVRGTQKIRAIIDSGNTLKEDNERNNELRAELTAGEEKVSLPDLSIGNVYITRQNQVAVRLVNKGHAQISERYWQKNVPTIYIYRNGRGWGGVTLKIFDPGKHLTKPGGEALYIFENLIVHGTETIKVVVDSQNTLSESDENNNEISKEFKARR